ncbi:MAG: purine-nucleoside phosphorylase [Desulfocapsa sp.]|nr:purine-nucleoside phosphorylase [Desulfocapsa sp.]
MKDADEYQKRVEECVSFFHDTAPFSPDLIVQLGTGLGDFGNRVTSERSLPYSQIPHFPQSTVDSHSGNLIFGHLNGKKIAVLQGRFHHYEGYSTREVAFPIRVLSLLGAKTFLLTNAAGGLNPLYPPGTIMVLRDHLNFLGENPLRGPNIENWGPRFPDLSTPYSPKLIKTALDSASHCKIKNVVSGVYVCIPGPSLETPAETRWLRSCGADAVGMSSVPEIIVAIHAGMDVLGLSVISNVNDPDNFEPIILEDIIATTKAMGPKLERLLVEIIGRI